jgi:hypothetical protein
MLEERVEEKYALDYEIAKFQLEKRKIDFDAKDSNKDEMNKLRKQ